MQAIRCYGLLNSTITTQKPPQIRKPTGTGVFKLNYMEPQGAGLGCSWPSSGKEKWLRKGNNGEKEESNKMRGFAWANDRGVPEVFSTQFWGNKSHNS